MNIEECLSELEGKAALVRCLANSAMRDPELVDAPALSGVGDVCGEIERLARAAKSALDVDALCIEVKRRR